MCLLYVMEKISLIKTMPTDQSTKIFIAQLRFSLKGKGKFVYNNNCLQKQILYTKNYICIAM